VLENKFRLREENPQDKTGPSQKLSSWTQKGLAGFREVRVFEVFPDESDASFRCL
jgi:hypothetical protein